MTPLIFLAAAAAFAVTLAAAGALGRADAAPAGSPYRHGKAVAGEFGLRLAIAFRLATIAVLVMWFGAGPR